MNNYPQGTMKPENKQSPFYDDSEDMRKDSWMCAMQAKFSDMGIDFINGNFESDFDKGLSVDESFQNFLEE